MTIEWPDGADGQPLVIWTSFYSAAVFKAGGHVALATEFVRFWSAKLARAAVDFSGERMLPSIPKLLEQPFWLDPSDRHHMVSAIQFLTRRAPTCIRWCPAIRGTRS